MNKFFALLCLISLAIFGAAEANAAPDQTPTSDGDSHYAASAYAVAARSFLEDFVISNGEKHENLDEAAALAKLALDIEPYHEEGLVAAAIAFSFMAREMSVEDAFASGHGPRARALAEAILSVDPVDGQAHGFLAVWHLEVFVKGGSFGAAAFNASRTDASQHYVQAVEQLPDEAGLHWQYARSLVLLNGAENADEITTILKQAIASANADEITTILKQAIAAPTKTKVDGVVKDRAAKLLKLVAAEDWSVAKTWAQSNY